MKANSWAALGLLAILIPGMAVAAEPADQALQEASHGWQGWRATALLRADGLAATQGASPPQGGLLSLQGKLLPSWGEHAYGRLEARLSTPGEDTRAGAAGAGQAWRWLEASLGWQDGGLDLRLGQQVLAWGRADGLNPTDSLAPRNLRTRLPFDDDQRFGIVAARALWTLLPGTDLSLVYSPVFSPSLVVLPQLTRPVLERRPQRNAANAVWAVKLERSDAGLDGSLSLYHGPSLLPDLRLQGGQGGVQRVDGVVPQLETCYDRVTVLGADIAHTFGRTGLRAEAAWTQPHSADDGGPAVKQAQLYAVLGAERLFTNGLNLNLQWWARRVVGWQDPLSHTDPVLAQLALQNAIGDGQQARLTQGLSLRLNAKWLGDTLEADLLWVGNLSQHDHFLRPVLHYAWRDGLRLSLGAVLNRGPAASLFGRKQADSRAFVELRHAF